MIEEGLEGPPLVIEKVERAMFVRYAGASGDFNPIHWDREFARDSGYPDVFAQGMFTAGCLARFVTGWMGPDSVRRLRVRFTGQVWPGDRLVCRGTITKVYEQNDEIRADLDLTVEDGDGEPKISGWATCVVTG